MHTTSDTLSDFEHNQRILEILTEGVECNKFDPSQVPEMLLSVGRFNDCIQAKLYWTKKLLQAINCISNYNLSKAS
jgi:hypothetical protein